MSSKSSVTAAPAGILSVGSGITLKLGSRFQRNSRHRSQPQAACGERQGDGQSQTPEPKGGSSMPRYVHIDSEDPHYLQELTPNLCVARHAGATSHAPSGRPFTAILNIKYFDINTVRIPKKGDKGESERGWGPVDGVSRYDLVAPAGSKYTGRSISGHLLRQFQIGLALGFLTQELDGELPCILITGAPVDSITVAAAYLAFKLGQPIGAMIEAIDSHKDIRKCWKGLLPEEGMRKLSEIVL
ncbi:hypothetical protein FIBSPDRAFT_984088 [Athelia psychrophila]|uniref:Uncharacterized protein n=1 Tax=Athelia psychrophila TaxID=1759441 RepID=A0A166BUU0_9AGAM|nr:hypothetical protein FIBSPDRAFT_984088 [Fibularhizoctonia sp. CBS 109695]